MSIVDLMEEMQCPGIGRILFQDFFKRFQRILFVAENDHIFHIRQFPYNLVPGMSGQCANNSLRFRDDWVPGKKEVLYPLCLMDEASILMDYLLRLMDEASILMDYLLRLIDEAFILMDYPLRPMDEAFILVDYLLRPMDEELILMDYLLCLIDEGPILMDFLFIRVPQWLRQVHEDLMTMYRMEILVPGRKKNQIKDVGNRLACPSISCPGEKNF